MDAVPARSSAEVIQHPAAAITMEPLPSGKDRLRVSMNDPNEHIWKTTCETSLPRDLVELFLDAHGPAGLCEVLDRVEDPGYVQSLIRYATLSFLPEQEFAGKRLLDFGCGSGASTAQLARMFPNTTIVGLELLAEFLVPARALADHLGLGNVTFVPARSGDSLPDDIGQFDLIVLSSVYEHLLPSERKRLLPQLWEALSPNGVLFVHGTPYRWYVLEGHTTALPFLNYLPDWLALRYARLFAGFKRRGIGRDSEWEPLLRGGIRGATEGEILRLLKRAAAGRLAALKPTAGGYADAIDLWYAQSVARRPMRTKAAMRYVFKTITRLTGSTFAPDVTMAVRKTGRLSAGT